MKFVNLAALDLMHKLDLKLIIVSITEYYKSRIFQMMMFLTVLNNYFYNDIIFCLFHSLFSNFPHKYFHPIFVTLQNLFRERMKEREVSFLGKRHHKVLNELRRDADTYLIEKAQILRIKR